MGERFRAEQRLLRRRRRRRCRRLAGNLQRGGSGVGHLSYSAAALDRTAKPAAIIGAIPGIVGHLHPLGVRDPEGAAGGRDGRRGCRRRPDRAHRVPRSASGVRSWCDWGGFAGRRQQSARLAESVPRGNLGGTLHPEHRRERHLPRPADASIGFRRSRYLKFRGDRLAVTLRAPGPLRPVVMMRRKRRPRGSLLRRRTHRWPGTARRRARRWSRRRRDFRAGVAAAAIDVLQLVLHQVSHDDPFMLADCSPPPGTRSKRTALIPEGTCGFHHRHQEASVMIAKFMRLSAERAGDRDGASGAGD